MHIFIAIIGCVFALAACGTEEEERLNEFRTALPSQEGLSAPAQGSTAALRAVGDPALFPASSADLVEGINGAVGWSIKLLRAVTDLPPTLYNSETDEYVWGPFPNDDGPGYVTVYIRKDSPDSDYTYSYAMVRGIDRDLANSVVVVAGGATPDSLERGADEYGEGALFVDFEADRTFDETHDPEFDPTEHDRGRFVAVFNNERNPDSDSDESSLLTVVAAFRNFVSQDDPDAQPTSIDYLYGRLSDVQWQADFINYRIAMDITEGDDRQPENLEVQLAFLNDGVGRAEVMADGGSLASDEFVTGVECWDEDFARTFLTLQSDANGGFQYTEGSEDGCIAPFDVPLSDLDVPSLADVPADDYAVLVDLAENGFSD